MSPEEATTTRDRIVMAGIDLFRRQGYVATTVDEICAAAGVSKGSFFHYFSGKESLAETCLGKWNDRARSMDEGAPYQKEPDPRRRLQGAMEFYVNFFSGTAVVMSCLAGTVAQEVFESNPDLLTAAHRCFADASERFAKLVREAATASGATVDAESLARLWTGAIQGALIIAKTSRDAGVIGDHLRHVKTYIESVVLRESE
jgi:TetR/AcrR family transcriptional repressor of nem operon